MNIPPFASLSDGSCLPSLGLLREKPQPTNAPAEISRRRLAASQPLTNPSSKLPTLRYGSTNRHIKNVNIRHKKRTFYVSFLLFIHECVNCRFWSLKNLVRQHQRRTKRYDLAEARASLHLNFSALALSGD